MFKKNKTWEFFFFSKLSMFEENFQIKKEVKEVINDEEYSLFYLNSPPEVKNFKNSPLRIFDKEIFTNTPNHLTDELLYSFGRAIRVIPFLAKNTDILHELKNDKRKYYFLKLLYQDLLIETYSKQSFKDGVSLNNDLYTSTVSFNLTKEFRKNYYSDIQSILDNDKDLVLTHFLNLNSLYQMGFPIFTDLKNGICEFSDKQIEKLIKYTKQLNYETFKSQEIFHNDFSTKGYLENHLFIDNTFWNTIALASYHQPYQSMQYSANALSTVIKDKDVTPCYDTDYSYQDIIYDYVNHPLVNSELKEALTNKNNFMNTGKRVKNHLQGISLQIPNLQIEYENICNIFHINSNINYLTNIEKLFYHSRSSKFVGYNQFKKLNITIENNTHFLLESLRRSSNLFFNQIIQSSPDLQRKFIELEGSQKGRFLEHLENNISPELKNRFNILFAEKRGNAQKKIDELVSSDFYLEIREFFLKEKMDAQKSNQDISSIQRRKI